MKHRYDLFSHTFFDENVSVIHPSSQNLAQGFGVGADQTGERERRTVVLLCREKRGSLAEWGTWSSMPSESGENIRVHSMYVLNSRGTPLHKYKSRLTAHWPWLVNGNRITN